VRRVQQLVSPRRNPYPVVVPKRLFVYIGASAAGGPFLERQLAANRATFHDAGIAVVSASLRGDDTSRAGPSGERDGAPGRGFTELVRRGLVSDYPTVLVSNTRLAGAPAQRVARVLGMLADHDVHLIYGVPDFGAALEGEWQRHVLTTGRAVSLDAWIKELAAGEHRWFWRTYGLSDVFGRWRVTPGDVHVVIVPAGPERAGELWTRFTSAVGAPATLADGPSACGDLLDLEELELMRRVHVRLTDGRVPGARSLVRAAVTGEMRPDRDPSALQLPLHHRSWIDEQATFQRAYLESSGFEIVGNLSDLEVDEWRFDTHEALPDEQRLIARGMDASAALAEGLIRGRARRTPSERRESVTGGADATRLREIVNRTLDLASSAGTASAAIRRRVRSRTSGGARQTYYLHIGAPKTGSSYLQRLLWTNRHALMRGGVYVPGRSQADHFWAGTDFRGRPYVTQAPGDRWQGAWDRLIDDAERSRCVKVIISSEFLAESGEDEIAAGLERLSAADVRVIYATREFAGLLGSVWQQGVQVGPAAAWPEWLDAVAQPGRAEGMWLRHDVANVCERWNTDEVDEVSVLLLPRQGGEPDELWRRFQSIVGWTVRTRVDVPRVNESLGYSQAEFLRQLQHRLADIEPRHERTRVTKNLIARQALGRMERVDLLVIPERLRAWVEAESAKRRDQLVLSKARIVGDLDDLHVVESRFCPNEPEPRGTVMVDAAVRVIERLATTLVREHRESAMPS
jgi:hypothetical protein